MLSINQVTIEELLTNKLLALPEPLLVFVDDKTSIDAKGGIYVFYSRQGEPLYVGITTNFKRRITQHITGRGNKDLKSYITENAGCYIELFPEPDVAYQEFYESYMILKLNPLFNINKTNRKR